VWSYFPERSGRFGSDLFRNKARDPFSDWKWPFYILDGHQQRDPTVPAAITFFLRRHSSCVEECHMIADALAAPLKTVFSRYLCGVNPREKLISREEKKS
jgi:hypothetical protein